MTASPQLTLPRSNSLTWNDSDWDELEFDTHPGRFRSRLVNNREAWDDDRELSDEILVRLWLARQRALARAFSAQT